MSGDHVPALQIFDCDQDAEVVVRAAALLDSKPENQGIEIWRGDRLVARVPRMPDSHQRPRPDSALKIVAGDVKNDGE